MVIPTTMLLWFFHTVYYYIIGIIGITWLAWNVWSSSLIFAAFMLDVLMPLSSSTVFIPFWVPSSLTICWTSPFHIASLMKGCFPPSLTFMHSAFNAYSGCSCERGSCQRWKDLDNEDTCPRTKKWPCESKYVLSIHLLWWHSTL